MRRADLRAIAAYAILVLVATGLANSFWLFLLTSAVITAVVAVSVGVIYDNAGLLSLCQMTFAGMGAWTVGWLNLHTDLPYLVMLVPAALVPMVIGAIVGIPALRLRGQNLAVFTLVFAAAFSRVFFADGFPGLIQGNRVSPPSLIASDRGFFVFCAVVLGLVGLAVTALRRARTGRWWYSVRRSERATAALGRSVVLTKLTAFAASAAIAGLGGGLLVALNGIVSGASFAPLTSMTILTSALMFGAGNFEGALLAGLFAQLIPNFLSDLGLPQDIAPMLFAIGGIVSLSQGEGGLSAAIRGLVASRRKRDAEPSEAVAAGHLKSDLTGDRQLFELTGPVLQVENASVRYGAITALDQVSLSVDAGALVGLIGPNGAGKSTLIDLLAGFLSNAEGTVKLTGVDITNMSPQDRARTGLRRSFQQGHTPQDLTLGGYVDLAAPDSTISVDQALSYFSLPAATTPISELDVGSRRILEVCGVVASQPVVALLDEPAAGLSGHDRENFISALARVPKSLGTAIVLIEHDLDVVASLCDSVVVLDFGKVIASGPADQVLRDPAVVAAYLGVTS